MKIWSFSKKGESRLENKDYFITKALGDSKAYAIVLDGATSKSNSLLGAKEVAKGIGTILEETCGNKLWDISAEYREQRELLSNIIRENLINTAIDNHIPYDSMGCTLMLVLYNAGDLICYHVGDGEIGLVDCDIQEYKVLSKPVNGFNKSYTYLISSSDLKRNIRIDKYSDIESVIIAIFTDGAERFKSMIRDKHGNSLEIIRKMESESYEDDATLVLIDLEE